MTPPNDSARRAPAFVILLLLAILAAILWRSHGPEPQAATAPPSQFSAERAMRVHRAVLPPVPHPLGSTAHDVALANLVAQFRALGYDTSVQRTFACNASVSCAPVANVIAQHPGGAGSGDALVLTAHYDSVAAGPGATDDGIGVATMLEVARAIRDERFRNRVTFLITDGEEDGLLGAEAFVADAAVSKGTAAVINVEARGTSGSSYLFETSRHNRWLLPIVAGALPRPSTASFFFSIYELLPNDTDLTVFKRGGFAGVNFANIGDVSHYHTRLDDFAHLSPRLLQDDGDHVLAMARAFGNAELRQMTDDNAVWFDVLNTFIVWWPQRWSMPLALLMLAILIVAAIVRLRDREVNAAMITTGVGSFFFSILIATLVALLATWIVGLRTGGAIWVAQPGPLIAAIWLLGIGVAIVTAKRLYAYAAFDGLFLGHALCWCALSISLSMILPGASYLAIVPATTLAVGAVARAARETAGGWLAIVAAAATAILHFPLALTLYDAVGRVALPVIAAQLALVATTFTPLLAAAEMRRALVSAIFAGAIVCIVMALVLPPYTSESPRRLPIRYVEETSDAHWDADDMTPALHRAAAFGATPVSAAPWLAYAWRVWRAPAPALSLPAVELQVVSDVRGATRRLSLLLRSQRNARRMFATFHAPSLESVRVNGIAPPPPNARGRNPFAPGWHYVGVYGTSEARIDLTLAKNEPIDFIVSDETPALPPIGSALASARDRSNAVPWSEGDGTATLRRMTY